MEQIASHPDPLPSDGRGNSQTRCLQFPKRLDPQPRGARFSLSHPMGEGRGEGKRASKSGICFCTSPYPEFIRKIKIKKIVALIMCPARRLIGYFPIAFQVVTPLVGFDNSWLISIAHPNYM